MRFLLAAAALYGHVGPLAAIGGELRGRGHHVALLTGGAYSGLAADAGLEFRPLPDEAGGVVTQGRTRRRARLLNGRDDILDAFVRPLPAQHDALAAVIHRDGPWDALVCDSAFLGALPLLLTRGRDARPAVYGTSVTPLSFVSVDCAPFGSALQPGHTRWSRLRNRQIHWLLRHGPLRVVQRELDAALGRYGLPGGGLDFFDHAGQFDVTFHLGAADFEYPRREMPPSVRFVGPLPPRPRAQHLPEWWDDLRHHPVVHVTQGTLDNQDLGKLIGPTVRALADDPVLTVVATAGRPESAVCEAIGGPLPSNVRLAGYLPYEQLLPRTAVLVSNGGYGGVQQSLRHGVPLVVAGNSEDKPEVAARVRRVGAGIDLRTGRPSPRRIRRAVRRVLDDPAYRDNAAQLSQSILALGDPRATVADTLEEVTGARCRSGSSARQSVGG